MQKYSVLLIHWNTFTKVAGLAVLTLAVSAGIGLDPAAAGVTPTAGRTPPQTPPTRRGAPPGHGARGGRCT